MILSPRTQALWSLAGGVLDAKSRWVAIFCLGWQKIPNKPICSHYTYLSEHSRWSYNRIWNSILKSKDFKVFHTRSANSKFPRNPASGSKFIRSIITCPRDSFFPASSKSTTWNTMYLWDVYKFKNWNNQPMCRVV